MMERRVERSDWASFCEGFSARHRGWLVTVNVVEASAGGDDVPESDRRERRLADEVPLQELMAVSNPHGVSFLIETGDEARTTRVLIERPRELHLRQSDDGADEGLRIDTADGQVARLTFRAAARPEEADGLADRERES